MVMRQVAYFLAASCVALSLPKDAAAVVVHIDLSNQSMHVEASNGETFDWPISSARSGYSTPHGYYRAQRLELMHYSRKYHMSPMPHSIFFRGGYAIHGTGSLAELGRPASHGCVRLSPSNAALLYSLVEMEGAKISITGTPPASRPFYASHEHFGYRRRQFARRYDPRGLAYAPYYRFRGVFFNLGAWLKDPSGNSR
jgi:L,D-transpeptidase catalytic domain